MRLELYQAECERIASQQTGLLDEARDRLKSNIPLTLLEQGGVLHALQVLVENAIGKSKHWHKASGRPVPVSAYDAFASLQQVGVISLPELQQWNAAIGLRNRIRATALILHRQGAHMPLSSTLQKSRSHSLTYAHVL